MGAHGAVGGTVRGGRTYRWAQAVSHAPEQHTPAAAAALASRPATHLNSAKTPLSKSASSASPRPPPLPPPAPALGAARAEASCLRASAGPSLAFASMGRRGTPAASVSIGQADGCPLQIVGALMSAGVHQPSPKCKQGPGDGEEPSPGRVMQAAASASGPPSTRAGTRAPAHLAESCRRPPAPPARPPPALAPGSPGRGRCGRRRAQLPQLP